MLKQMSHFTSRIPFLESQNSCIVILINMYLFTYYDENPPQAEISVMCWLDHSDYIRTLTYIYLSYKTCYIIIFFLQFLDFFLEIKYGDGE